MSRTNTGLPDADVCLNFLQRDQKVKNGKNQVVVELEDGKQLNERPFTRNERKRQLEEDLVKKPALKIVKTDHGRKSRRQGGKDEAEEPPEVSYLSHQILEGRLKPTYNRFAKERKGNLMKNWNRSRRRKNLTRNPFHHREFHLSYSLQL
jgi:hypothetical protein